jgi:hypothetical protein
MKKFLTLSIGILAFLAVVTVTAQAQTSGTQHMRARIPFAFNVGSKELPAGIYNITVLNPNSDRKVLQIRSLDGRVSAIINTLGTTANATEMPKLVFNRYGERYFFARAHMAGEFVLLTAVKSRTERTEEHTIASTRARATVALVAQ